MDAAGGGLDILSLRLRESVMAKAVLRRQRRSQALRSWRNARAAAVEAGGNRLLFGDGQ